MRPQQSEKGRSFRWAAVKTVFFSFLLILISTGRAAYGRTVDSVLATVGDEIITFTEYKQFAKGSGAENQDEVDQAILRKLIEEKIIVQEAKRKGFEVSDAEVDKMVEDFKAQSGLSREELENFLKGEGLDVKTYRRTLRDKAMASKLIGGDVDSKIIIREQEIGDYYKKNKKEFISSSEKVEVKAIFLRMREDATVTELTDLKRRALRIVALLRDGYNFDSLVDEYSDEPLKSQGGMLGKFARGGLLPPLDRKAFSLREGEISDPVWVSDGVYILMVLSKSGETFKTFDEVKGEISNNLKRQKRDRIYNEWIKALWEKSLVTINQG